MLIGCNIPSAVQGSTRENVSIHRTDKHRTDRHWGNKQTSRLLQTAASYADSAYFSNINGTYERTLAMADSSRSYLNRYYLTLNPDGKYLMVAHPMKGTAAEIHCCTTVCQPTTRSYSISAMRVPWQRWHSTNGNYTIVTTRYIHSSSVNGVRIIRSITT